MSGEHHRFEKKSLRKATGHSTAWTELAECCVAFATAVGGTLVIGIEDGADFPPPAQRIPSDLPATVTRRMRELTVNVTAHATVRRAEIHNGPHNPCKLLPK